MTDHLQAIYNEMMKCEGCPKSQWSSFHKEIGWGTMGEIFFVGQSPAFSSLGTKEGESHFDRSFKSLLKEGGIFDGEYFFTNLVKLPPVKQLYDLTEEEFTHCYSHLHDEIKEIKPMIIVSLGTTAGAWLKGYMFPVKYYMPHPAAIRYGNVKREFIVEKLKEISERYRKQKVEQNKLTN